MLQPAMEASLRTPTASLRTPSKAGLSVPGQTLHFPGGGAVGMKASPVFDALDSPTAPGAGAATPQPGVKARARTLGMIDEEQQGQPGRQREGDWEGRLAEKLAATVSYCPTPCRPPHRSSRLTAGPPVSAGRRADRRPDRPARLDAAAGAGRAQGAADRRHDGGRPAGAREGELDGALLAVRDRAGGDGRQERRGGRGQRGHRRRGLRRQGPGVLPDRRAPPARQGHPGQHRPH